MSFFGFGPAAELDIVLTDAESRRRVEHKTEDGKKDKIFLLSLRWETELYYDRGNHHEFVSLVKDLARPGEISQSQSFDFEFTHVEKPYESYTGQNVKLRWESIPIRLFLAGYELTPTMRDINKKFSVRYYLNLVLIDEEERRYFKQQKSEASKCDEKWLVLHFSSLQ
ncbi:hypothetical protein FKM82_014244 [Ascaphus truei]